MENNASSSDYQVIRFHRGRPSSITSERENSDLDDNQLKKSTTEESPILKVNQKERAPLENLEK